MTFSHLLTLQIQVCLNPFHTNSHKVCPFYNRLIEDDHENVIGILVTLHVAFRLLGHFPHMAD